MYEALILSKSRALLRDVTPECRGRLDRLADRARIVIGPSSETPTIANNSVALVVTSPPFLDVVDYQTDNWLRCWFSGIDAAQVPVTLARHVDAWTAFVTNTFDGTQTNSEAEWPCGVRGRRSARRRRAAGRGSDPCGIAAGLEPVLVLVNAQQFTKTANCWGVTNNRKGTNTNRVVLLRKRD